MEKEIVLSKEDAEKLRELSAHIAKILGQQESPTYVINVNIDSKLNTEKVIKQINEGLKLKGSYI